MDGQNVVKEAREAKNVVLDRSIKNLADTVDRLESFVRRVQGDGDAPIDGLNEKSEAYSLARLLALAPENLDALGMRISAARETLESELF